MPPINPPLRRARDRDGSPIEPMSFSNMRSLGVRSLDVERRSVAVNVDRFPEALYVPDMADPFLCSVCGGRHILALLHRLFEPFEQLHNPLGQLLVRHTLQGLGQSSGEDEHRHIVRHLRIGVLECVKVGLQERRHES